MDHFYDLTGHFVASMSPDLDGGHTVHNAMGSVVKSFTPTVNGGGFWTDALGHTIEHVKAFGDSIQHFSPTGVLTQTDTPFAGRTLFNNALGQTMASYDPMSGNFSNAIGQLIGSKR